MLKLPDNESPVGVLAATDRPYSVGVAHHRLAEVDERPTWRGRTHLWAFGVALPATVVLVAGAHPGRPRLAALIYAVTLVAMFSAPTGCDTDHPQGVLAPNRIDPVALSP